MGFKTLKNEKKKDEIWKEKKNMFAKDKNSITKQVHPIFVIKKQK